MEPYALRLLWRSGGVRLVSAMSSTLVTQVTQGPPWASNTGCGVVGGAGSVPLCGLMVVAGFGFWVGHRRKPCKAFAFAGDDNVFDAVFLLGGATKCPSFLVAVSRLHAGLSRFSDGARFSSSSLGTPSLPSLCSSPPSSPWLF
jgi:hypothetical protein